MIKQHLPQILVLAIQVLENIYNNINIDKKSRLNETLLVTL